MKTTITFDVENVFEATALMTLYRLMSAPDETGFLGLEELAGIDWIMLEVATALIHLGRDGDRFGAIDLSEKDEFDAWLEKIKERTKRILGSLATPIKPEAPQT